MFKLMNKKIMTILSSKDFAYHPLVSLSFLTTWQCHTKSYHIDTLGISESSFVICYFLKNFFKRISGLPSVSNSLDLNQAFCQVQTVCKGYQQREIKPLTESVTLSCSILQQVMPQ